jgi:hypothetical protein
MAILKTVVTTRPNTAIPFFQFGVQESTYYNNLINGGLFTSQSALSADLLTSTLILRFETQQEYDKYLNDPELITHRSQFDTYNATNNFKSTVSISNV